ncbi:hypothetical protein H4CHR_02888 [Variovorax sp. PBS-H4]|uniref:hypothetical protein n=1 Tax=Variovorax sp. PBS-H4 TaxID=434008 RepID=UPI0013176234|nr:hypothetical protein [Variovorax sp. PBS-H4]VTU31833.1 hypothetical protein H4CHR_02888 [Variovorax sp. PBS-H4]
MTNKVIPSFRKSKFADRGKEAENAASKYLSQWASGYANREFNRLVDTKAAGRIIKASKADFEFFYFPTNSVFAFFGLLEVKETEHDYRLERAKVSQMPRLVKHMKCGGTCHVLVHHKTIDKWRCINALWMRDNGDKGSWNIAEFPAFDTPGEALRALNPLLWSL